MKLTIHTFFIILASILFLITLESNAQDWPAPESTWRYCRIDILGSQPGPITYSYVRDTLVSDTTYALILNTQSYNQPVDQSSAMSQLRRTLLRSSNDTVFRRVDDQEYIFFVNNLNIGQGFTTYRSQNGPTNSFSCVPELILEVVDVYFIDIEDTPYRHVVLEDMNGEEIYEYPFQENVKYTYIEEIGLATNFPYYWDLAIEGCEPVSDGPSPEDLFYYSDTSNALVLNGCIGVSTRTLNVELNLQLWPNPSRGQMHFSSENIIKSTVIYDMMGRELLTSIHNSPSGILDLSQLPSGVYFLSIQADKGLEVKRIIIE